jgi:MFS family permease
MWAARLTFLRGVSSLCIGLFLSFLDTSIVATVLYTVGKEFGSETTVTWIATAYTLSYLACCVVFASIGDIIGRQKAYLCAFLIFTSCSLGCGFAHTLGQLIALRALQGIGGSGLYTLTLVIFPQVCPTHMTQHIAGIIGMVLAVSGVLGPVLGGLISDRSTWRWVFWMK